MIHFYIFDSYDSQCPYCFSVIPNDDRCIDPINDAIECPTCSRWVHVGSILQPQPHTCFSIDLNRALAFTIYCWFVEHIKPGHWLVVEDEYHFLACEKTGKPVSTELYASIMGGNHASSNT